MKQSERWPVDQEKKYLNHFPLGFVTLKEMQEKLEKKRNKYQERKSLSKNLNEIPQGFVTYDEMVKRLARKKQTTNATSFDSSLVSYSPEGKVKQHYVITNGHTENPGRSVLTSTKGSYTTKQAQSMENFRQNRLQKDHSTITTEINLPRLVSQAKHKMPKDELRGTRTTKFESVENYAQNESLDTYEMKQRGSKVESCRLKYVKSPSTDIKTETFQPKKQLNKSSVPAENKDYKYVPFGLVDTVRTKVTGDVMSILIMNVDGPYDTRGSVPSRRRQVIQAIIKQHRPSLVLFQEFKWKGIWGKIWNSSPIPDNYEYCGHEDASIMYNSHVVATNPSTGINMRSILEGLQRSSNNGLRKAFPLAFDPISRMYTQVITFFSKTLVKFLCISWHGPHNRKTKSERVSYFEYLIEYLKQIYLKIKMPILIAGDFNVNVDAIETLVKTPFYLYKYKPTNRRSTVIDFFITTGELAIYDISPLDLNKARPECKPDGIFDHDPIMASVLQLE